MKIDLKVFQKNVYHSLKGLDTFVIFEWSRIITTSVERKSKERCQKPAFETVLWEGVVQFIKK